MPARNPEERRALASIAALARSAKTTGAEMLEAANNVYRDSFNLGHQCEMCERIEIDQALPPEEIARRGYAAYRAHMRRLALRRDRHRRLAAEHAAAADAADAELADNANAS
jgi:hypothetical protein